jgi:hypothetical protein
VLANPSPGEDVIATQLYTEIIKCMPVACRFKDNGLGDWFLGIADGIADFVGSIGKPIMGAVTGYQQARGNAPVMAAPQHYGPPKLQKPASEKRYQKQIGGRRKKNGEVQKGPRNNGGSFKGPAGKAVKNYKKAIKQEVKKEVKKDVKSYVNSNIINGVNQFG